MARKALAAIGIILSVAGTLGFFTFADDLRHSGELAVTSGLLLAGISLLVSALRPTLPLQWFSVAVLAGLLVSSVLDAAVFGLVGGIATGAIATWWRRSRAVKPPRPAA
jgi:Na+/phosphate symporter